MKGIQTKFRAIGDDCCLACSYLYGAYHSMADECETNPLFIETAVCAAMLQELETLDAIDKNGFVKDAEKLLSDATGRKWRVTKKRIESIQELPDYKYAVVNFEFNKHNHWVLFKDKKFLYNTLEDSQCFKYGKPVDARILSLVEGD